MSSNYCRSVKPSAPVVSVRAIDLLGILLIALVLSSGDSTRAARDTRHSLVRFVTSVLGGDPDGRGEQDPVVDRGGAGASARRRRPSSAVCRVRFLLGRGQGAGQVRDV